MTQCKNDQSEQHFNETLKVIGDFWTLRIIDALRDSPLRFCELERVLGNSNPATLTNRLKKLEETGYLSRQSDPNDKQSVHYQLLDKGHLALPVIAAVKTLSNN